MKAATYARFSTDLQREASIADQERVCEQIADRHGFQIIARFSDKAISGGTAQRPGYQALLAAARRGDIDVIIAEDVSRLWRGMAEQSPRLAELHDMGVAVVTLDLDSRTETAGILGAVLGASAESFRKEIARRTRRGLEGRARAGAASGSKAYGYIPASQSGTGQIEIDPDQAEVVRWIFTAYADGWSPQKIAADLNRRRIPSPAANANRPHETKGWHPSTIAGNARRGAGILNTDTYHGTKVWGRTARVRSAADSRRRKCVVKPERDWITVPMERLRIVPESLWKRVKARQSRQQQEVGQRVAQGLSVAKASRLGKRPQYLFSGLLHCADCGARMVMADARSYQCAGHLYGRGCENNIRVRRDVVEDRLLSSVKRDLLTPGVVEEVRRRLVKSINAPKKAAPSPVARVKALRAEIQNLTDAIAAGMLRASPALADRLARAEAELATLQATPAAPVVKIDQLPALMARYQRLVDELEATLTHDVARARTALQRVVGDSIIVRRASDGTHLEALLGLGIEQETHRAVGVPISVAPRAGVEPATPRLGGECSIH